jgi:hypothetical protein
VPESFSEFKTSFSYGSRSDLSFKFLKSMPDDEAAEFLRRLLEEVGDAYDTGDVVSIIELAIEAQITGYRPTQPSRWSYDDRPFTPLRKPLSESRVGLMTSSGHFVAGADPQPFGVTAMTQQEAEDRIGEFLKEAPTLSHIPRDTPGDELRVRHGGYDVRSALRDYNVSFPRDALLTVAADRGASVAETLYSFTGAAAQGRVRKLAPEWAQQLHDDEIDVLLLVPV